MRRFRQSLYPVIFRTMQATLAGFVVYLALSASFYGNLLMLCGGEFFAAALFALSLGALTCCIGLIDDLRLDIYTHAEKIAFAAHGKVPPLASFISGKEIVRVSYTAGPLAKLLKTRKIEIVTREKRVIFYVKQKDLTAVCTALPEEFVKTVMAVEQKEQSKQAEGVRFPYSPIEPLRAGLQVFIWGAILLITVYPAVIGILLGNGISLKSAFPNLSFGVAALVIFAIALLIVLGIALLFALCKATVLALTFQGYTLSVTDGYTVVRYGAPVVRVHAAKEERLRMIKRREFLLSPVKNKTAVSLCFAEGRRRFVLPLAGRPLNQSEREGVNGLFSDFSEAELKKLPVRRLLPLYLAFALAAFLPITLFAVLESALVLWLYLPCALALWQTVRTRAFGSSEGGITAQGGILFRTRRTVRVKDISAVRISSGAFSRPFKLCNAEMRLSDTEMVVEIPGLTLEEGEKALFLAKHTKK